MTAIDTGRLRLEVEEQGEGAPILLIMGLGAQLVLWPRGFVDALSGAGFRAIRFDNRDIGKSQWFDELGVPKNGQLLARRLLGMTVQAPYTLSDMAADTASLIDALGLGRVHLVGASLGGMVAQTVAIEHPDKVRTLTSIMSHAGNHRAFALHPRVIPQMLGKSPGSRDEYIARMVRVFRGQAGTHGFDEAGVAAIAGDMYDRGYHPQGFARQLAAVLASGSRLPRLPTVRAPTLVIHGTHDPLAPLAAGRQVADAIPGAKFVAMEGMGHDLPRPLWPRIVGAIAEHVHAH